MYFRLARTTRVFGGLTALALAATPAEARAQLTGKVVTGDARPVAGAYIAIRHAGAGADTAVAASARTDIAGVFQVRGLEPGRYMIRVHALGYAPFARDGADVTALPSGGVAPVNLGRLALTPVAARLEGVQVTEERDATVLAADRNAFNVRDLPATAGGTAVDVLRQVPAVEVDGDNTVSLRGNANVVVQIDGRPSPLRGQQLGNYLAQLPANLVARVEVATNPSAKNDPDSGAGIINLVLARRADLGTSGGLSAAAATNGLASVAGNLGRQEGPWTGFASYAFYRSEPALVGTSQRFDASGASSAALFGTFDGYQRPLSHAVTLRGEYQAGRYQTLAADAIVTSGVSLRATDVRYSALDANGQAAGGLAQRGDVRIGTLVGDYALAWRRVVDPAKNALAAEVRFTDATTHFENRLYRQALGAGGASDGPAALTRDAADGRSPSWRAQGDWTRALGAETKLETGVVGIQRRNRSTFDRPAGLVDDASGDVPGAGESDRFAYRERVAAAYGLITRTAGAWTLQGGVRLERALTRMDVIAGSDSSGDASAGMGSVAGRFDFAYRSAFPSALVTYALDAKHQLKASYARRIGRPDAGQLLPFLQREDTLNVFSGNPALRPEYTNAYEVGYQQTTDWGSVQVTPFYRRTPGAVRYVRTVDVDGIARATFDNVALAESYGADLAATARAGRLSLLVSGSAYGARTDAGEAVRAAAPDVSFRTVGWSARANGSMRLTARDELSVSAQYRAPQDIEAGRQRQLATTTFAFRRKLKGDAATLTLRATDPFNGQAWGVRTTTGSHVQVLDRNYGARALALVFNYTFGKPLRFRPPPPQEAPAGGGGPPG
jgi:outer membrane receptor protein involved in Fe transport